MSYTGHGSQEENRDGASLRLTLAVAYWLQIFRNKRIGSAPSILLVEGLDGLMRKDSFSNVKIVFF
ncbi:hypothetical protein [Comamonas sp. 4034]|uniref:hypothetical protein n=1 Tax=Comamonas sp. 4034 TaxID=3156455 RepID=UPI003D1C2C09